jgi:hypothetical protein
MMPLPPSQGSRNYKSFAIAVQKLADSSRQRNETPGGGMRGNSEVENLAYRKWYEQPRVYLKVTQLGPNHRPASGTDKM